MIPLSIFTKPMFVFFVIFPNSNLLFLLCGLDEAFYIYHLTELSIQSYSLYI